MISWQQEEYLDPGIWNHLKSTICPEILPAPTVLPVPSLPVPASLPSASSSEHLDPTFKQCHTFTTMYSAAYGQVLRRRITEEAMIMPVENRRDRNICYYTDQPQIANTDIETNETSTDDSTLSASEPSVAETVATSRNTSILQCKSPLSTARLRKKRSYGGQDSVDQFLLNQVAKHVKYDKLGTMSRDLAVSDTEYTRITTPNVFSQNDQIYKVKIL